MINNMQTNISLKLLTELSKRNILVITCDEKHLPSTYILPISGHYNSLKILEEQIS
jgi:CRISPR-associated protein Cas1